MSIAGGLLMIAGMMSASKIIGWLGGDPEGEAMAQIGKRQSLTAMQQGLPQQRLSRDIEQSQRETGAAQRRTQQFGIEAEEIALGRNIRGPRELLESVAQRMGTTPEDLGRRLSPTRMGDYSSLSKAAFGRVSKRVKGPPSA